MTPTTKHVMDILSEKESQSKAIDDVGYEINMPLTDPVHHFHIHTQTTFDSARFIHEPGRQRSAASFNRPFVVQVVHGILFRQINDSSRTTLTSYDSCRIPVRVACRIVRLRLLFVTRFFDCFALTRRILSKLPPASQVCWENARAFIA